ncbi:MAG: uracil-DNA glycosylase [Thermoleophilaceae bacterium]|jgi:DNA polymerase|nr:uracil-DNA glycosylase [Thermoleophilaceae bacterium]
MPRPAAERRADLVELYRALNDQHGCPLSATRTHVVFGMGNADADLMFVGEAPGATEDQEGKPFVGRAGRLLDTLLEEVGLRRADVFICNILKCRPPGNRDPLPEEIEECKPYLMRQIELIEPRVICTLGNFATKTITGRPDGITRVRGRPQAREFAGVDVQVYPLLHPAAALRTPKMLEMLREDFARIPALLEAARPAAAEAEPDPFVAQGQPQPDQAPPQLDLFGQA